MSTIIQTDSLFRRTQARTTFNHDLIAESLDEAAFLYAQARLLRTSEPFAWTDSEDFEARMEAHLVTLDDPEAFPPLDTIENLDDPGTLYAVLRTLCLQGRREDLSGIMDGLSDPALVQAAVDALQDGLPEAWMEPVLESLWSANRDVACWLIGRRRYAPGVSRLLACKEPSAAWAWALGRLDCMEARPVLKTALGHDSLEVGQQAALALLRLGDRGCLQYRSTSSWLPLAKGLAGENPTAEPVSHNQLMGLGLWGQPGAVPALLWALNTPELAPTASRALFAITGAPLTEQVFVPDVPLEPQDSVKEGGLGDEVPNQTATSSPSPEPPSEELPDGDMVTRTSQDPAAWEAWWLEHAPAFIHGKPYRLGKLSDAAWLRETLNQGPTPHWLRAFTLEELAIRHGIFLPLEADMPVKAQKAALQNAGTAPHTYQRAAPEEDWHDVMMRGIREEEEERARRPKSWWKP